MSSNASVPLVNGGVPFESQTRLPATSIITKNLPAPVAQYVGTDALLRIGVSSQIPAQNLTVRTRVLRSDDGVITASEDKVITDGTGNQALAFIGLTEGFLLSCEITCESASIVRGAIFVCAELCHGSAAILHRDQLLFQDYVSSGYAVSWPGSLPRLSTEGPGQTSQILNAGGFGAGSELAQGFVGNTRVRVMSFRCVFTTSAVAGNRFPSLNLNIGGITLFNATVAAAIPASTVATINLGVGVGAPSVNNNNHILPIPENIFLQPNGGIGSLTAGLLAGDAYTQLQTVFESWIIS